MSTIKFGSSQGEMKDYYSSSPSLDTLDSEADEDVIRKSSPDSARRRSQRENLNRWSDESSYNHDDVRDKSSESDLGPVSSFAPQSGKSSRDRIKKSIVRSKFSRFETIDDNFVEASASRISTKLEPFQSEDPSQPLVLDVKETMPADVSESSAYFSKSGFREKVIEDSMLSENDELKNFDVIDADGRVSSDYSSAKPDTPLDKIFEAVSGTAEDLKCELKQKDKRGFDKPIDFFVEEIREEFDLYNDLAERFYERSHEFSKLQKSIKSSQKELVSAQFQTLRAKKRLQKAREELEKLNLRHEIDQQASQYMQYLRSSLQNTAL